MVRGSDKLDAHRLGHIGWLTHHRPLVKVTGPTLTTLTFLVSAQTHCESENQPAEPQFFCVTTWIEHQDVPIFSRTKLLPPH